MSTTTCAKLKIASLLPSVGITSVSGSSTTSKRRAAQAAIASRSSGRPDGRRIAHPLAEPGHKSLADQWVGRLLRVAGAEVDHLDPALLDAPGGLVQTDERVRGLALENGGDGHGQTVPVTKAQSDSNARSSAAISTCSSRRCA